MTTEKDSVSNSTDGEQDQIQSTSFEENSTNQVQSVTPDNQILVTPIGSPNVINPPASHCSPVRRRGTVLRSIGSLNSEEKEAFHQECSKTLEKISKHPSDGYDVYIQKRWDIWEKIDPTFQGSERLLEEKRLIEKLLVEEELHSGAVRTFRITLQSIQKELSSLSEEACRPIKSQKRDHHSRDPGTGFASITLKRSTIQTIEPVSFVGNCAKPNDALISAVGFVVCSLVGSYFVIKLVIKLSSKVESNTIIQAINFLDLDIMQETELLTLKY